VGDDLLGLAGAAAMAAVIVPPDDVGASSLGESQELEREAQMRMRIRVN
jgi:hypothetical protein